MLIAEIFRVCEISSAINGQEEKGGNKGERRHVSCCFVQQYCNKRSCPGGPFLPEERSSHLFLSFLTSPGWTLTTPETHSSHTGACRSNKARKRRGQSSIRRRRNHSICSSPGFRPAREKEQKAETTAAR